MWLHSSSRGGLQLPFASKVSAFFLTCMETGKKQLQTLIPTATSTHFGKSEEEYNAFEQFKDGHKATSHNNFSLMNARCQSLQENSCLPLQVAKIKLNSRTIIVILLIIFKMPVCLCVSVYMMYVDLCTTVPLCRTENNFMEAVLSFHFYMLSNSNYQA